MKIPLIRYEDASRSDQILFQAVSKDGFTVNNHSFTNPKIIVKSNVYPRTRLLFSLGHELAHVWLEHPEENNHYEEEANYFSGYLLGPHPLILQQEIETIDEIASAFNMGHWSAEIAKNQVLERLRNGPRKSLFHEQWLIKNIKVERGFGVEIKPAI
jgi:hypothetical protein